MRVAVIVIQIIWHKPEIYELTEQSFILMSICLFHVVFQNAKQYKQDFDSILGQGLEVCQFSGGYSNYIVLQFN